MTTKAREFIDFWIENSVHLTERLRTAGASQDVTELTSRRGRAKAPSRRGLVFLARTSHSDFQHFIWQGRCNALASSHDARIQMSRSSSGGSARLPRLATSLGSHDIVRSRYRLRLRAPVALELSPDAGKGRQRAAFVANLSPEERERLLGFETMKGRLVRVSGFITLACRPLSLRRSHIATKCTAPRLSRLVTTSRGFGWGGRPGSSGLVSPGRPHLLQPSARDLVEQCRPPTSSRGASDRLWPSVRLTRSGGPKPSR